MSSNDCILVISDLQMPYHHIDAFEFLTEIKKQFKPTRIINIGDESDFSGLSFHGMNPDAKSAGHELIELRHYSAKLEKIFPEMDICESNHGSLPKRRALAGGLPKAMLRTYNEILDVGPGWRWHPYIDTRLPGGQWTRFVHNYESNILTVSKNLAMNVVAGHHHSKFEIQYWSNGLRQFWGASIGCLIDDSHSTFDYNKRQSKRPILGTMIIKGGIPILIPMRINKAGRWIGCL